MPGLLGLTQEQGDQAQYAMDEAEKARAGLYLHNLAAKTQNFVDAAGIATDLVKAGGKAYAAKRQSDRDHQPPGLQQQIANEEAGRDPFDSGSVSPSLWSGVAGAVGRSLSGGSQ